MTGFRAHLWQRVSAVWLLVYVPLAVAYLAFQPVSSHAALMGVLSQPLFWVASVLTIGLLAVHAWVGVRDAILDYAPRPRVGLWLMALATMLAFWVGFALYAAWRILVEANEGGLL
ncbi:hypothetical protein AVO41_01815 [Thiomicrospira sp. WB1]|nr:hypothetical protein AVO41_01815 [Thiomicrospira sp. WB1]